MTDAERERELDQAHGNAWSFPGAAAPFWNVHRKQACGEYDILLLQGWVTVLV